MTSSLVGSEMCIRDSVRTGYTNGKCPCSEISTKTSDLSSPYAPDLVSTCLLYTSDAADDM
eukprot:6756071-Prorocentrum_lima.AAC.1